MAGERLRDDDAALGEAYESVERFLAERRPGLIRQPAGALRKPFIDPSSVYTGQLWDWDAYFTLTALRPHLDAASVARDCLENFLDHQRRDGSVPFRIATDTQPGKDDVLPEDSPLNSAKPVLAQMALLGAGGDPAWARHVLIGLRRHVRYWETRQRHGCGLLVWRSHRGSGADNHPGVYGRPPNSTAGIDLNCLYVEELRALAKLADLAGETGPAARLAERAEEVARLIRHHLWDRVAVDFCHADVLSATPHGVNQRVDWLTPLRFRSWVGFYALWARVATPDQAEQLVRRVFQDRDLLCTFGLRTLSAAEPLFSLARSSNPSNWQGPVWVMSNYIAFAGLLNYGFLPQAQQILYGTLAMLAQDIERHGELHEFYHPDSGEGLMNPGFLNWNLLATAMYHRFQQAVGCR